MSDIPTSNQLQEFLKDKLASFLGSSTPREWRRTLFYRRTRPNRDNVASFTGVLSEMQDMKISTDLSVADLGVLSNNAKIAANKISQWLTTENSTSKQLHDLAHFYRSFAESFEKLIDPTGEQYTSPAWIFLRDQVYSYTGARTSRYIRRDLYKELSGLKGANEVAKESMSIIDDILKGKWSTLEKVKDISDIARLTADRLEALCQSDLAETRDMTRCATLGQFYRHLSAQCDEWSARGSGVES